MGVRVAVAEAVGVRVGVGDGLGVDVDDGVSHVPPGFPFSECKTKSMEQLLVSLHEGHLSSD